MPRSGEPVLLSSDRDGVRTLTLNRPDRKNAINAQLWIELADALRAAARDRDLRALVVTGAGGAFCSGADKLVMSPTAVPSLSMMISVQPRATNNPTSEILLLAGM